MPTQKQRVLALLEQLPDDCSLEEIIDHLDLIAKIDVGIRRGETEGYLTDDEVDARLATWLRD